MKKLLFILLFPILLTGQNDVIVFNDSLLTLPYTGYYLSFQSDDDYIQVDNTEAGNYDNTEDFSFSFWYKPDVLSGVTVPISKSLTSGSGYRGWQCYAVGTSLYFRYYDNGSASGKKLQHQTSLSTGTWYHIMGTWNNGTIQLYVNGISSTNSSTGSGFSGSTDLSSIYLIIGSASYASSQSIEGDMAKVALFHKDLNANERLYLLGGGTPETSGNPLHVGGLDLYYDFSNIEELPTIPDVINNYDATEVLMEDSDINKFQNKDKVLINENN